MDADDLRQQMAEMPANRLRHYSSSHIWFTPDEGT